MNVILRPMQRHEVWRSQYRARRYLEHLTGPSLEQRFQDVFLNLLTIQPDAKLGVLPITPEGHFGEISNSPHTTVMIGLGVAAWRGLMAIRSRRETREQYPLAS
jgi:hypothetical protein